MIYDCVEHLLSEHRFIQAKQHRAPIAATSGAFDLLHVGHLRLLDYMTKLAEFRVVLLNSDQSIKEYKSDARPVKNWYTRAEILSNMKYNLHVVNMLEPDPVSAIRLIRPNYWVKGQRPIDEIIEKDAVFEGGGDVVSIWTPITASTTLFIHAAHNIYKQEQGDAIKKVGGDVDDLHYIYKQEQGDAIKKVGGNDDDTP
jgi:rfaE bifunctional protein nucleotidyltransferase chain/domain